MARRKLRFLAGAAFLVLPLSAAISPPARAQGSIYPENVGENRSELARALGGAGYVVAATGDNAEFNRLIQAAVARHPALAMQSSQAAAARAEAKAARAALYPRISASIDGDYVIARRFNTGTSNVVESLRPKNQVNAGVTASQLIFDGGATFARIRSAKAKRRESDLSIDARINELSLAALSAYHDVAVHQAILALGAQYVAHHEKLLANVKERERAGAGSRADVLRAEARLAAARSRVAQIKESARVADVRYAEYFREPPATLSLPDYEALAVATREEAVTLALANNPLVGAAAARTESAEAERKAAKAARLPELRANVTGTSFDVLDGANDYDVRAGVNLSYDLFAGGARSASISRARNLAERQIAEEDSVRLEIEREAAIAFERREAANEQLAALELALVANSQARAMVSERFRAARGDLLDVIQAESDWFEAGVGYLSGLADRDMASYELMEFTGDLLRYFSPRDEDRAENQ
ncbi:MAG: TolC family protein [Parvularculaceae bacterium]|nr:TolC family protein [Parvularculaceae bacterium]